MHTISFLLWQYTIKDKCWLAIEAVSEIDTHTVTTRIDFLTSLYNIHTYIKGNRSWQELDEMYTSCIIPASPRKHNRRNSRATSHLNTSDWRQMLLTVIRMRNKNDVAWSRSIRPSTVALAPSRGKLQRPCCPGDVDYTEARMHFDSDNIHHAWLLLHRVRCYCISLDAPHHLYDSLRTRYIRWVIHKRCFIRRSSIPDVSVHYWYMLNYVYKDNGG